MKKKRCIAIIPARGGSKRIKKKNIKLFFNRPIISYAIKNAKNSKLFDEIIVSTDDLKIKKIAKKLGASVPFLRPKKISGNFTPLADVMSHAIKIITQQYKDIYAVCCIFPSTPLLEPKDLRNSFKFFCKKKWDYLFGGLKYSHPPRRGFTLNRKKGLKMVFSNNVNKNERTQDFIPTYHDSGQFYWAKPNTWLKKKKIFSKRSTIYLLPESSAVDIDTIDDWKYAEYKFSIKKKLNKHSK